MSDEHFIYLFTFLMWSDLFNSSSAEANQQESAVLYLPHSWVPPVGWSLTLDEPPILRVSLPHGGRALLIEVVQIGTNPKLEATRTRLEGRCFHERTKVLSDHICLDVLFTLQMQSNDKVY